MSDYDKKKLAMTERVSRIFGLCAGVFLTVATVFMFVNIMMRFFAGRNMLFIYDLCGLCSAGVASFSIAYATLVRGHSTMDIVMGRMSRRVRGASEGISGIISLLILAVAIYAAGELAVQKTKVFESTTTSHMPTWIFRWIFLIGLILSFCSVIIEVIDNFRIAAGQDVIKDKDELKAYKEKIEEEKNGASAETEGFEEIKDMNVEKGKEEKK